MNSSIQRNDDTCDFKVVPPLRFRVDTNGITPVDPSDTSVVNTEYVPAPYKAAMGAMYKGDWYTWIETDPTAPMIPPQFRNPPKDTQQ